MKGISVQTRIQLRNVLYCTDLSPSASSALPQAVALARHFGSILHALHVRPALPYIWSFSTAAPLLMEPTEAQLREKIEDSLSGFPDVRKEILIEEGVDIWLAISNAIEEREIDLVVLSTRGRSGLSKILLGSVAEEILRLAPCPVLTVGPNAPMEPLQDANYTEILYATDFTPEACAAAPYAVSLAQEFQAHLTLLHVLAEPEPGDLVTRAELQSGTEWLLRQMVPPESELWCEPHLMIGQGTPANEILDVAQQRKSDLIVLGVRRPGGVSTRLPIATAHKVVSEAACPVLTVRGSCYERVARTNSY